jgi:prepilin-type N-terminal cleavage/methylation domain-containing protein/prepilin-type processing-associated H-X9-DG protein
MKHQRPRGKSAFTLVELLVAIAIIGIIAALLLAAVSQSKAKVRKIKCVNNVRQLGMALQGFKTDYNFYPPLFDPGDHSENRNWKDALGHQMNIRDNNNYLPQGVWHCPSAFRPIDSVWNENEGKKKDWTYIEYNINAYGLGSYSSNNISSGLSGTWQYTLPTQPVKPTPHVKEPGIAIPSEMYAIGDAFYGSPNSIIDGQHFGRASDAVVSKFGFSEWDYSQSKQRSNTRHQGKANVVFSDGHVESPTLKFLFEDTSDAALARWNRDHLPHREKLSP